VVLALNRVASSQKAWQWTDPVGFKNGAVAALVEQDPAAGLRELEGALVRDPTSPYLHRVLALVHERAGRHPECLEHLAEARAISPGASRLELQLTDDDALWVRMEGLRRRLDLYPRRMVHNVLDLARELRRAGDFDDAYQLLSDFESHPEVAIELARWDLEQGHIAAAATRVTAIAERTRYPTVIRVKAWSTLAEIHDRAGDSENAIEAAREALRLDSESPGPHVALARLAERRGADDEALEHLRRAWGVAPADVNVLLHVARVAERVGRFDDARLALERVTEIRADDPNLLGRLVEYHLRRGEYMRAAMRLSEGLNRFPTDRGLLRLAEELRKQVAAKR